MRTSTVSVAADDASTRGNRLLRSTEVVYSCVDAHVCSHINTILQVHHDLLNTLLQEIPSCSKVVLVRSGWHGDRHRCGGRGMSRVCLKVMVDFRCLGVYKGGKVVKQSAKSMEVLSPSVGVRNA